MFIVKMTGALMMVAACSYTGYALSQRFVQRHRQLTVLQMGLEILSSEIAYMRTPLPQAFKKIALRLEEPVSGIFFAAGRKLEGGEHYPRDAWRETLQEKQQETALSSEDISVLGQLGVVLEGDADSDGQVRQVKLLAKEVERLVREAEAEKSKNVRVWRYLGLLGGLGFAILFF
jgi:stage III sporulation protein AB